MRIRILFIALAVFAAGPADAKLHMPHLPHLLHRQAPTPRPTGNSVAAQAMRAADANRWGEAHDIAAKSGDPALIKLIEFLDCARPGTDAGFARISAFVHANPGWPNMGALYKRGEDAMPSTLDPQQIVAWFDEFKPHNPDTMPLYYEALVKLDREDDAEQQARDFWINGTFTLPQLGDYRQRFSQILQRGDDAARADRLVWDKAYIDARAMLPYLAPGEQAAIQARIALATHADSDAALATVPADKRNDPGLLYARASYAMAELRDEDAATILEHAPQAPPRPAAWSTLRLTLTRHLLDSHNYEQAYRIAANDKATEPSQIAESRFLAGWIALRYLKDADQAAEHFVYMYNHVVTPTSKARAAYWIAETKVAPAGLTSQQWLEHAASHVTTFYGQLAAEALGRDLVLPAEPQPSAEEARHFENSDLVRATRLLHQAGDASRVTQFLDRMAELAKAPTQQAQIVRLARELGAIPASVQLAKKALQNNICTLAGGYPLLDVHVRQPEPALVHGIIRQESLFNPTIVSPAGAIGLMQLMPGTASGQARKLGVKESNAALSQNPNLNVTLGSAYLQTMIDNFGGSYVLAIASYNAGPGRVHGWLQDLGDPREGSLDPIDWIELIPVSETRNYVQRVLENTGVYRARLAGGSAPVQLLEDLRR